MNQEESIRKLYDLLWQRYGDLGWWPARSPYEVMVGAVLTQNTAWSNVEKAIANFGGLWSPQNVLDMPDDALADIIRPAGFFRQKTGYLKTLTAWFARYGFDPAAARQMPLDDLRRELLHLKGIGKETADSILLYALDLPSFVVDAYTKRLLSRLGISAEASYDRVQALFCRALQKDVSVYKHAHALIVEQSKTHCKAKPACAGCSLTEVCLHKPT